MSGNKKRRDEVKAEISRIEEQKADAIRQLQNQEYVHLQHINARRRLFKDLDEQLVGLRIQYEALGGDATDE